MAGLSWILTPIAQATSAKILPLIILAFGLRPVFTAPSAESDLWTNPCFNHPVRHTRSTAEKELNFFINTLNKQMFMELKVLYPKNLKKVKGNCPRLNRLIEPIRTAPNITIAHQNFYKSMVEFGVFLEKLEHLQIKTNTYFNLDKRKSIYEKTKNTLRLTICEFNDTMMREYKISTIGFLNRKPDVNTRCLPKTADLSRVQMLDMQFFKKLRKFFKQGKRILKGIKRKSRSDSKVKDMNKRTRS